MTMSLETLRDELREHTGTDIDDLPDPDADLLLNRAFWEVMNKFRFRETECTAESTLTIGDSFLSLPVPPHLFEALRKISVKNPDTLEWTTIKRFSLDSHENLASDDVEDRGCPIWYVRDQNGIRIMSKKGGAVDKPYEIRLKYWQTLNDLDDTNTEVPLPVVWDEILLFGAVWRLYRRLGSHALGREMRNAQIDLISSTAAVESKEEEDSPLAGIEIPNELTQI
jgi:hypothetical protein